MKRILIMIFLLSIINTCFSQEKTNLFFNKWASKVQEYGVLRDISIQSINLDSLSLDDYRVNQVFLDLDYNQDGINDLIVLISKDYRKQNNLDMTKNRLLLFCNGKNDGFYNLEMVLFKLLNQGTEGVYDSNLKINFYKEELILQEVGVQINTSWVTRLTFNLDKIKNKYKLTNANSYMCEIYSDKTVLGKLVDEKLIKEIKYLGEVDYYDYFPFGFTDTFPEN